MSHDQTQSFEIEPASLRVVIRYHDEILADSTRALLLREVGHRDYSAVYYLPRQDVRMSLLVRSATTSHCPIKGVASYWTVQDAEGHPVHAAWSYEDVLPGAEAIRDHVAFYTSVVSLEVALAALV